MTPEENEQFLNDLRNDQELRQEAQLTALMIQELQERQAKEDAGIIQEVLASKKRAKTISMVRWSLSVAAMFILIFGATWVWNRQSDTPHELVSKTSVTKQKSNQPDFDALFMKYYKSYDMARGADDEATKELAEMFNRVGTDEDVSSAINSLQTVYDNAQSNEADSTYIHFKNDIAWYLALAYVKDHQLDNANKLLKSLAENGDSRAKELKKALRKKKK